jgi:hypothetical protein
MLKAFKRSFITSRSAWDRSPQRQPFPASSRSTNKPPTLEVISKPNDVNNRLRNLQEGGNFADKAIRNVVRKDNGADAMGSSSSTSSSAEKKVEVRNREMQTELYRII